MSQAVSGGFLRRLRTAVIGTPIATKHAHHERLPVVFGLPVFASDALSSVAYATEEIQRVLLIGGVAFLGYTFTLSASITALIILVAISYYQTIHAYPGGGGAYTVASENLGSWAGRIAGASLLIDYVLTVSVSVSAGVLALVAMVPGAQPYIVHIGLLAVMVVAIANLRGTRESGVVFAIPTYSFVVLILGMISYGLITGGNPLPESAVQQAKVEGAFGWAAMFLVLRAFASGCTALTGIEAVSNGVQAFKPPEARHASKTLALMALILAFMFLGTSWLAQHLHIVPMPSDAAHFKTVIAMMTERIFGEGHWYFYAVQIATVAILILAANTAFADFPRLSSIVAKDGFLPRQLMSLGDKLVFQNGIIVLSILSGALIVAFHGDTHMLIPLYAIGVFLSFTLSQFGMVVKQMRERRASAFVSLVGGIATGVVTIVIAATKFAEGGWIVLVAMAIMLVLFTVIRRHYKYLAQELSLDGDERLRDAEVEALLLVPRLHKGVLHAISFARASAKDVRAVHVTLDRSGADSIKNQWTELGVDLPLVILESPYRSLVEPITDYVDQMLVDKPGTVVVVIVPQAVPKHWWQGILHNNAAVPLKMALKTRKNVVITNVRYFLS